MRVKVTYTAEYEDVPDLVNDIVEKCRDELKKAADFKFNITDLEKTAIEINSLQSKLSLVSAQLEDCYNISRGYITASQNAAQENNSEELINEEIE